MGALADVLGLRAKKGIDRSGRVLLEGLRLAAARAAQVAFECVIHAPEFFSGDEGAELVSALEREGVPTHRLAAREFSRLSYKADGVIGVVRVRPPVIGDVVREKLVVVLDAL